MENLRADKISEWIHGTLTGNKNAVVNKVSTNIRSLEQGSMFFAIRTKEYDGHQHLNTAIENGAAIVVSETGFPVRYGCAVILVEDTVKALGDLARRYMETFSIPVICITGSAGKATTGEMIAQVLSTQYNVHKTMGIPNNDIELSISVLGLTRAHTAAVFELGINDVDGIKHKSIIIQPNMAVITNIGVSHIDKPGSRQNILRANLDIIQGMKENGRLILNGDDELLSGLNGLLPIPVTFYGINEAIPLHAFGIESLGEEGVRFTVNILNEDVEITLSVPGLHEVSDALAAIACGIELGITNENIKKGLAFNFQEKMRMSIIQYNKVKIKI